MPKLLPRKSALFGTPGVAMIAAVLAVLLFGPEAASAADTCIQDVWKAHNNKQNLTCTAGDVTLSSATNINVTAGGECPTVNGVKTCSCFAGQTVTFTADFRMDLTADTRYDVGFYIATDGDPNQDGAITGTCAANASLASNTSAANFINLDGSPDVCGDITGSGGTAHNPLFVTATISAPCPSTPGQKLQLPFATTWRQPGSNEVCDGNGVNNGTTLNDVYPGAPSKCNTGTLVLDITSVSTTLKVTKSSSTPSVPETGGTASYSVTVENTSAIAVTLQSLTDDKYGDLAQVQGSTCVADNVAATCEVGGVIAAGASCSCTFSGLVPPGDTNDPAFKDTVTACADNNTNPTDVCAADDAEVPYSDVSSAPTLVKTATSNQCVIDTAYSVVVNNTSALDTLTLNTLTDDKYGDITTAAGASCTGTCIVSTTCGQFTGAGVLPAAIAAANNYTCSFVGRMSSCNTTLVDEVTGGTVDDDGVTTSPKDTASVTVTVTNP